MKAQEMRQLFLDFFMAKGHKITRSAPMVIKDDPTLMFTNAGMNQFKDIFLGHSQLQHKRIANSQKCLRVSGKHNDLEEVGHDTYHHTMFEMLGNWSFGDYFKKEAIEWAWEFLTEITKLEKDRLYVTIFKGDITDNVERDEDSERYWQTCFPGKPEHILEGSKKDNFWEMGDTGPCGPCSEIHIDIREESEREKIPGHSLVNKGHPEVIEIWNLVFIQYNRKADGKLEPLPARHVDTGMGFERLCMVVQGKKSNYDTDLFQPLIREIAEITGKKLGAGESSDTAMRVVADHLRAVAFSIADGQLPSNNRAGYVIRRILRRAVRYAYNNLGTEEPFIYRLVPALAETMGDHYPELITHKELISKIIREEETAFLKTLGKGLKMLEKVITEMKKDNSKMLPGKIAFELYDTFGFPADLTQLILKENSIELNIKEFEDEMKNQKNRSREDASSDAGDWTIIRDIEGTVFTGYEKTEEKVLVTKYRMVRAKGKSIFHIVLDKTPFYAESGGQVGDSGILKSETERIRVIDTIKENNLIIHVSENFPSDAQANFMAQVDTGKRQMTANNHTATHLIHHALRTVLGNHVEQKGSLVAPDRLRFDFSHFNKLSREEILKVEEMANRMIRENKSKNVIDNISLDKAKEMGAMALFGEKYGETVRVVEFGDSVELCGGTHVESTAEIGIIKIVSEGAIASGIRRIEAITAEKAFEYINERLADYEDAELLLKSKGKLRENLEKIIAENAYLRKSIEKYKARESAGILKSLEEKAVTINGIRLISGQIESDSPDTLKSLAFESRKRSEKSIMVIGSHIREKAYLAVMVTDDLVSEKNISAVKIIKEISVEISGGGGGQHFLATAGGKNPGGIKNAIKKAESYIRNL